jgi:ATPase subunit of ABC transporter with duplicated ATPase domains
LDIPCIEAIETMLSDYHGALVLVSHDGYFVREVFTDQVWIIDQGRLIVG